MNNKDYIDERIVNAFSAYVSKIIHNSSIDFIRKLVINLIQLPDYPKQY